MISLPPKTRAFCFNPLRRRSFTQDHSTVGRVLGFARGQSDLSQRYGVFQSAEMKMDLYRVDLSAVVSKYIGETEKNLLKVFETARAKEVILFFDEADSLFGKRTETGNSHDRYTTMEVNYLLQRLEEYSGLVILATNYKKQLDEALLRKIRFVVEFP